MTEYQGSMHYGCYTVETLHKLFYSRASAALLTCTQGLDLVIRNIKRTAQQHCTSATRLQGRYMADRGVEVSRLGQLRSAGCCLLSPE